MFKYCKRYYYYNYYIRYCENVENVHYTVYKFRDFCHVKNNLNHSFTELIEIIYKLYTTVEDGGKISIEDKIVNITLRDHVLPVLGKSVHVEDYFEDPIDDNADPIMITFKKRKLSPLKIEEMCPKIKHRKITDLMNVSKKYEYVRDLDDNFIVIIPKMKTFELQAPKEMKSFPFFSNIDYDKIMESSLTLINVLNNIDLFNKV